MHTNEVDQGTGVTRRAVVAGAGVVVVSAALAGCEVYGGSSDTNQAAETPAGGATTASGGDATTPPGSGAAAALVKTADVPVGGGKILADQKVVVTQPTGGDFKAFTAVCTHQGCTVATVEGGTINCACHGSKYAIADGSVAGGPAPAPLAAKNIRVEGDSIVLA
jgi:Rieske Fe-S protein